jgi:LPS sulfotransferase NodH
LSTARPRGSVFIATTPRSGSWLLAEGLRTLDLVGRPEEYFAPEAERAYRKRWHLPRHGPYDQLLHRIVRAGRSPTGVFGAKVHWTQFDALLARLGGRAGPDAAVLDRHFGPVRIVYLDRRDSLRQAISWYLAIATNRWWSVTRDREPAAAAEVAYDFDAIKSLWWLLRDSKLAWLAWFAANGIEPVTVTYESLAADYRGTLRSLTRRLGHQAPPEIPPPRLTRQAGDLTDRWVRAYRHSWRSVFGSGPPWLSAVEHQDASGRPARVEPPDRLDHASRR